MSFQNREWWKAGLIGVFLVGAITMAGETLVEDIHGLVVDKSQIEFRVQQLEDQRKTDRALLIELNATMRALETTQERLARAIESFERTERNNGNR